MKTSSPIRLVVLALAAAALACSTVTGSGTGTTGATPTVARPTRAATEEVAATEVVEEEATATDEAAPEPTDEPTPEPVTAYLGDVVEDGGLALTALQIEDPATPGTLYQPAPNTRLVAVEVVLGNIDLERFAAGPSALTLIDSEGRTYPFAVAAQDDVAMAAITLMPGERLRGWAAFEVQDDAVLAAVRFSAPDEGVTMQVSLTPRPDGVAALTGTPRTAPDLPPLGTAAEGGGYTLTALQVEDPTTPGFLYTPVEGRKLVAVEILVGNESGAAVTVNSLFTYLVDTEGYVYPGRLFGRDGQIETLSIGPGDKLQGWVSFELPDGATPEGVRYLFDLFSGFSLVAGVAAP